MNKMKIDEEKLVDLLSVVDGINVTYHRAIDDTENASRSDESFEEIQ